MALSDTQIERYARHIILQEVGGVGQERLLGASVLLVGAGGLGSPLLLYLAAAGVGRILVADDDAVSLSNLQRQVLHGTADVGRPKVDSAVEAARAVNPDATVEAVPERVTAANVERLLSQVDLVADGSDNFPARFLLNDACYFARKPLVSAAVLRFDGQLSTYKSFADPALPCYRCLFPAPPPPDLVPSCAEGGVLGALVGVMGSLQATEVIKELLGIGESLAGHLLIYDGLAASVRKVRVRRDPACPLCGEAPSIRDLSGHAPHGAGV